MAARANAAALVAEDPSPLLKRALSRDRQAISALLRMLAPVVHVRVARVVVRHRGTATDAAQRRQQIEDLTQEVFAALFAEDARALRAWDPARGMSLLGYVGLIADHQTMCLLRSGRRNPWRDELFASDDEAVVADAAPPADKALASRQLLLKVVDRMRAELTPKGLELFDRLVVHEEAVESVCASTGMSADAVHAWRSRLGKLARKIAAELESTDSVSAFARARISEQGASR